MKTSLGHVHIQAAIHPAKSWERLQDTFVRKTTDWWRKGPINLRSAWCLKAVSRPLGQSCEPTKAALVCLPTQLETGWIKPGLDETMDKNQGCERETYSRQKPGGQMLKSKDFNSQVCLVENRTSLLRVWFLHTFHSQEWWTVLTCTTTFPKLSLGF